MLSVIDSRLALRRYWGVKLLYKRLKLVVIEEKQASIKQNVLCFPAGDLKHKISQ